jgi:hypothetical protein
VEDPIVKRKPFRWTLIVVICLTLALEPAPARADSLKTDADLIVFGGVAIVAGIGVGVYFAIHHGRTVQGCVAAVPNGLEIRTPDGAGAYELSGATAEVKAGDRMRLKGKKKRAASGDVPGFIVSGVSKDYGACTATGHP